MKVDDARKNVQRHGRTPVACSLPLYPLTRASSRVQARPPNTCPGTAPKKLIKKTKNCSGKLAVKKEQKGRWRPKLEVNKRKLQGPTLGSLRPTKPPCFPGGLRPPDPASSISLNMSVVGHVTWKCILLSGLKTLDRYTIMYHVV